MKYQDHRLWKRIYSQEYLTGAPIVRICSPKLLLFVDHELIYTLIS